jgi:hypothetical protein
MSGPKNYITASDTQDGASHQTYGLLHYVEHAIAGNTSLAKSSFGLQLLLIHMSWRSAYGPHNTIMKPRN